MRRRLWHLHSWLGLAAGLGLLVIGLSGSLLVFRDGIEAAVNPAAVRVAPTVAGRLPFDTLLAALNRALPGHEVVGWVVRGAGEAGYADLVYVVAHGHDQWRLVTLNPFTGRLLSGPQSDTATLGGWLLELHYAFFSDHAGMLVVGLWGALLCLLGLTGLWLHRDFWRSVFTLRWQRGARLLFSDLHKFVGIASVAFNLLLGFTGAYWNLTHVVGEWLHGEPPPHRMTGRLYGAGLSLDALARDAARRLPGFTAHYLDLPYAPDGDLTLWGAIEPRGALRSPYGSSVTYDPRSGAFKALHDLRSSGWWTQAVDAFTPLHYGTFGGWPVKLLWALGGLAPGTLAITGFCIWRLRRRRARPLRPSRTAAATSTH